MFLIGLLSVSILWILNLKQAIAISAFTFIVFIAGLHIYQTDAEQLTSNYIVGTCCIIAFYCISRIGFSYHYNYFTQLKLIREKNNEINKINKTQTEILGIVAHDLRSPVNSIKAIVDILKTSPVTEEEQKEFYDLIEAACNDSATITHDLMDVARKAEHEHLSLTATNLNIFIGQLQQQWAHRIPGSRKIVFAPAAKSVIAYIHVQKMRQVFDNLINNAIKFTQDDGVIQIELQQNNNNSIISIKDNGIGIPEYLTPYMFDRFSKAGRRGLNGEKSYGLGLSICKQIIEKHGGYISVDSEENRGTIFRIELPNNT